MAVDRIDSRFHIRPIVDAQEHDSISKGTSKPSPNVTFRLIISFPICGLDMDQPPQPKGARIVWTHKTDRWDDGFSYISCINRLAATSELDDCDSVVVGSGRSNHLEG